ncbi:MAG TPA: hypothetical protein VJT73_19670, partial [Polyangiaceae bacterium]|nr:hypothetical protein [Polyangiaceae bacterium]
PSAARLGVLAGLVACAAALLLFFRQPAGVSSLGEHETPGQGDARERVKGASELLLVARRGGRVFPVDRFNHELGAGDEIRAVVTQSDPTRPWLLVASIDGSAKTNVYFPFRGQKSGHLEHVGRWEVPGSIVLDDSPGPERIFAFFSKEPLDAALVAKSLEALGREGWPAVRAKSEIALEGVVQSSVLLEKPVHDLER